ncbi:hypothetical protein TanjilG_32902 [Lupinus angustifolius]|uniref:Uncharacterized protein n=1 Tax=Lupinus angustifolius TaxID=3871 RepID=A0A4P1RPY5_LUPAN|nr:hypothetical protein TanjilG_32902 [Lupinus angustifolius]
MPPEEGGVEKVGEDIPSPEYGGSEKTPLHSSVTWDETTSLANRISAQRHSLCAPYRSRSVFATAGEAVAEAKPIATPTIKYEIGALLKDLMEWPSPLKSAYVIWELMAGNNPYGFDIRSVDKGRAQMCSLFAPLTFVRAASKVSAYAPFESRLDPVKSTDYHRGKTDFPNHAFIAPVPPYFPFTSLSSSLLAYGLLRSLAKERATALVPEANRLTCSCQSPPYFLLGLLWLLILSSLFLASGLASSCSPSLFETLGPWPGLDSPWLREATTYWISDDMGALMVLKARPGRFTLFPPVFRHSRSSFPLDDFASFLLEGKCRTLSCHSEIAFSILLA